MTKNISFMDYGFLRLTTLLREQESKIIRSALCKSTFHRQPVDEKNAIKIYKHADKFIHNLTLVKDVDFLTTMLNLSTFFITLTARFLTKFLKKA